MAESKVNQWQTINAMSTERIVNMLHQFCILDVWIPGYTMCLLKVKKII